MAKYLFGRLASSGKIVHIAEIPKDHHLRVGWACVCPCCDAELIAVKGDQNEPHFRHYNLGAVDKTTISAKVCSPEAANETALHMAAKEIIAEEKCVFVPDRVIHPADVGILDLPADIVCSVPKYKAITAKKVEATLVEIEKPYKALRPDATLQRIDSPLFIEFFVSHRKGADDIAKAREYGVPMLEIDLGQFDSKDFNREKLTDFLCNRHDGRKWLYLPISEEEKTAARQYYENHSTVRKYRYETECKKNGAAKFLSFLENEETYAKEVARLRDDISFLEKMCREKENNSYYYDFADHFEKNRETPFFVDIPVTGETVFQCDRRIWQSIVFNRYIFCRGKDNARFSRKNIFAALKDDHAIPIDWTLAYPIRDRDYLEARNLPTEAIDTYIQILEYLGFVETGDGEWVTVRQKRTIVPPDAEAAVFLKELLQNEVINQNNPLISNNIMHEIESKKTRDEDARRHLEAQRREEEFRQKWEKHMEKITAEKKKTEMNLPTIFNKNIQDLTNYDDPTRIFEVDGNRYVLCVLCNTPVKEQDAVMIGKDGNPNKGLCRDCVRKMK